MTEVVEGVRRAYLVYFKSIRPRDGHTEHDWVLSSLAVESSEVLSFMQDEDCKIMQEAIEAKFSPSLTKWQPMAWELKTGTHTSDSTNAIRLRIGELLKEKEFSPPLGAVPVDTVYYVEGDSRVPAKRPLNLFVYKADADRYAALVLGLTDDQVTEKVKSMPVFTER